MLHLLGWHCYVSPYTLEIDRRLTNTYRGFKLYNAEGWRIRCVAEVSMKGKVTERKKFSTSDLNIFDWASTVIKDAVGS